jgi:hypothetical protein
VAAWDIYKGGSALSGAGLELRNERVPLRDGGVGCRSKRPAASTLVTLFREVDWLVPGSFQIISSFTRFK